MLAADACFSPSEVDKDFGAETFIAVKTSECDFFGGADSELEFTHHRNKF
jgi:hypothetical protein